MKSLKWLDEACNNCGQQINSWDKRISKVLAYRYPCLRGMYCQGIRYGHRCIARAHGTLFWASDPALVYKVSLWQNTIF